MGLGVDVNWYVDNPAPSVPPFYGRDGFILNLVVTTNTRKAIYYTPEVSDGLEFDYVEPLPPYELVLGDDDGAWIDLRDPTGGSYHVLFHSGPGLHQGSEYTKVWVCSNGFICFDNSESTSPTPEYSPNAKPPNAVIAPYWSDLDPSGGSIRYGECTM